MNYSVFNDLIEGVQVISDDLRYLYLNDSVKRQGGLNERDVIGLKCEEVYPGIEESSAFVNIRKCIQTNEPINFLNRFDFPDGSHGYYELRMNRIPGGVLLFSMDRTEEINKEEQVRRANKRYEAITSSVHSALFEWDQEGNITFGNTIFKELCTLQLGHVCSTLDHVLQLGGPTQHEDFKTKLKAAIAEKVPTFNYYLEHYDSETGQLISYLLHVVMCIENGEGVSSFIGYLIDTSEDRRQEQVRELRSVFNAIFLSDRSIDQCLDKVLGHIVHFTPDFRVAECWLPNYDGSKIRRRSAYSRLGNDKDLFIVGNSDHLEFERGEGLPGVCMDQKELIWWNTLLENESFKRRDILRASNINTGVAIPLLISGELVAVIALFSESDLDKTIATVNQLIGISESIGHGIVAKRIAHQRDLLNDSSAILLFNTNPSGDILHLNSTAANLFGREKQKKITNFMDLLDAHGKQLFCEKWEKLISGSISLISTVEQVIKGDGRKGSVKINATKSADDDSVYIVALDISRENQLLDLLSLSNRMASIGFWTIDLLNKETILSGNARTMLGLPDDTVVSDLNMKFMQVLMPENLFAEMTSSLLVKEVSLDLKWERMWNGDNRQFRLIVRSEFDKNRCARISGVIQDITSIVKTETALETARANYLDLIDLSPIPICLYNPETMKVELANKKACEIYGYSAEEFTSISFDQLLINDDQLKALVDHNTELQAGREVYLGNFRHRTKSGEELRIDNFARRIHFQDKDFLLSIGVDRTESLELQQNISRAVINAQEEQRDEISRELHDNICQLMVASHLYLSLIKECGDNGTNDYLDHAIGLLETANNETRQLSHVLSSAKFTQQSFSESVDEVIGSFQLGGSIRVNTNIEPGFVNDEAGQDLKINLIRLLQEGISNAVKHSGATEVNINGALLNKQMILSIWDNGKGFDTHNFKPGIGIYNMKNRVQVCNGELDIHSEPGHGTLLEIRIPVEELQMS
jgi:PAS domain S-box-containing protein